MAISANKKGQTELAMIKGLVLSLIVLAGVVMLNVLKIL